jgi:hypothetical protein
VVAARIDAAFEAGGPSFMCGRSGARVWPSMCHRATNIAAITGPSTKPLMPGAAMPPRAVISTA